MIWNVTDVLIEYEKLFREAKCTLQDADMALLSNGLKRDDPTRKRIREMIQKLDEAA